MSAAACEGAGHPCSTKEDTVNWEEEAKLNMTKVREIAPGIFKYPDDWEEVAKGLKQPPCDVLDFPVCMWIRAEHGLLRPDEEVWNRKAREEREEQT